ncbi:MAG: glycosyltransferase [Candidatus Methanomethylicaceae archaeon]
MSYLDEHHVDPMGHLRLVAPLNQAGIEIIRGVVGNQVIPEYVFKGDIVVIQRHFPVMYESFRKIVDLARQMNKPVIYEIDDWLLELPAEHPDRLAHLYTSSLLPILEAIIEADLITVPTEVLRDTIIPLNPNVAVLANYFDDSLWQFRDLAEESSSDHLIVGYMGTRSHEPDLEFVVPVLLEILHEYSSRVQLNFWGVEPPFALRGFVNVKHFPWFSYCYSDFAKYFQHQKADIFIAPLADNLFNRCKSPLKYFEYTALGVPVVLSAIEPYISVVENGRNGLLASSMEDWRKNLVRLIEDRDLRKRIARYAQRTISDKWLLSKNVYRWKEIYEKVLTGEIRKPSRVNPPFIGILRSLNIQLFDVFQHQKSLIESQQSRIAHLETRVHQYESEIVQYLTSRSWRYTRPLRKLDQFIKRV